MSCLFYSREFSVEILTKEEERWSKTAEEKNSFKYNFWVGRFHMLPQSYTFSHGLCLNNFLQVLLVCNQRDQVPPFIYINQADKVSHLVIVMKLLGDIKYFTRSVKQAADAVGIWTEDNRDMKRVNSLYTMVSGRFNFKRNKMFDSLSWSSVVRDFYTSRVCIIVELNEDR